MLAPALRRSFVGEQCEVRTEGAELVEIAARTEKEILIAQVHLRKVSDEVPDVGSHPKLVNSANVDCYAHESFPGNYNENRMSRIFSAVFVIAAIAWMPSSLSAQQTTVLVNAFENQT